MLFCAVRVNTCGTSRFGCCYPNSVSYVRNLYLENRNMEHDQSKNDVLFLWSDYTKSSHSARNSGTYRIWWRQQAMCRFCKTITDEQFLECNDIQKLCHCGKVNGSSDRSGAVALPENLLSIVFQLRKPPCKKTPLSGTLGCSKIARCFPPGRSLQKRAAREGNTLQFCYNLEYISEKKCKNRRRHKKAPLSGKCLSHRGAFLLGGILLI